MVVVEAVEAVEAVAAVVVVVVGGGGLQLLFGLEWHTAVVMVLCACCFSVVKQPTPPCMPQGQAKTHKADPSVHAALWATGQTRVQVRFAQFLCIAQG
jgi:hypothetical protein